MVDVVVPRPADGSVAGYSKYRVRKSIDFAVLAVAVNYRLGDGVVREASMVLGAVAPVPLKMTEAEDFLTGKKLTEEVAREVADIALRDALPLANNAYKIDMAKVMIRRALGF